MMQIDSETRSVTPADVERAAAALAARLYHHRPVPNEKVVVILSGGNVTDEVFL
ncbi:MAG: hypothetical protein M3Q90_03295 [Candidatus Dormibacteraeota bacterium]|nr:hypothetical protein [Candidatus Dormibacteraeota bacterium]